MPSFRFAVATAGAAFSSFVFFVACTSFGGAVDTDAGAEADAAPGDTKAPEVVPDAATVLDAEASPDASPLCDLVWREPFDVDPSSPPWIRAAAGQGVALGLERVGGDSVLLGASIGNGVGAMGDYSVMARAVDLSPSGSTRIAFELSGIELDGDVRFVVAQVLALLESNGAAKNLEVSVGQGAIVVSLDGAEHLRAAALDLAKKHEVRIDIDVAKPSVVVAVDTLAARIPNAKLASTPDAPFPSATTIQIGPYFLYGAPSATAPNRVRYDNVRVLRCR